MSVKFTIPADAKQETAGSLSSLTTTEKGSLVGAVNEVNSNITNLFSEKTYDYTVISATNVNSVSYKARKIKDEVFLNGYVVADENGTANISLNLQNIVPSTDAWYTPSIAFDRTTTTNVSSFLYSDGNIYFYNLTAGHEIQFQLTYKANNTTPLT